MTRLTNPIPGASEVYRTDSGPTEWRPPRPFPLQHGFSLRCQ